VCAVAVADVGSVHTVCLQDVGQVAVERAAGLEDLEFWECGFQVAMDGLEPRALSAGLLFARLC